MRILGDYSGGGNGCLRSGIRLHAAAAATAAAADDDDGVNWRVISDWSSLKPSSSSSSLKFLEWPMQQRHHEDHYRQSKYEQYQTVL